METASGSMTGRLRGPWSSRTPGPAAPTRTSRAGSTPLSDDTLRFAGALNLPRFEHAGLTLLKRHTLVIDRGRIEHVLYPVFPSDRDAETVLAWLHGEAAPA